ncbi:MAG: hypothetical protein U0746_19145 [Gemmataceae bacterium]
MRIVRRMCVACAAGAAALAASAVEPEGRVTAARFPTVPPDHTHVRLLLDNAMRYAAPDAKTTDRASGYPYEGWNHDPKRSLFLRSFTQLTAIGLWMELLADVAAGHAETPALSRDKALVDLTKLVGTLRHDQRDPRLSAKGLLGNFLDLASGKRLGPLTNDVEKRKFVAAFGEAKADAIWKALIDRGWIAPRKDGHEADVKRGDKYGWDHFTGALQPYADEPTKKQVMALLDDRGVTIVFVDNANLSASAAKTIGTLLHPAVKDRPEAAALRNELEQFLEVQRDGYAHLYDRKVGLFYFGWDAVKDRLFGWVDLEGKWVTGHVDYLVNEFRGPATFVVTRYGLPVDALKNLGFKMKPYQTQDGRELFALAPWEGSAFQALGLGLWLNELQHPSWRTLLNNVVDIELDFAARKKLPGFLSESYTGNGTEYTGSVGIPAITVSPKPRVTDAASLYTLGPAYAVAPAKVERFLAANWPVIETLLTEHGPWEGFNVTTQEPIKFQTTAHTLSLALGLLNTGSDAMARYLESKGLAGRLAEVFRPGDAADLLASGAQAYAWAPKGEAIRSTLANGVFRVQSERPSETGIAVVPPRAVNLSGGMLTLRYRSTVAGPTTVEIKPTEAALIPTQIFTRLTDTAGRDAEVAVPLPATPGLTRVKEVVVVFKPEAGERAMDVSVTGLRTTPVAIQPR